MKLKAKDVFGTGVVNAGKTSRVEPSTSKPIEKKSPPILRMVVDNGPLTADQQAWSDAYAATEAKRGPGGRFDPAGGRK